MQARGGAPRPMLSKRSNKSNISRRRELMDQFREETSPLLSIETLETRLSQIDRIIQRKTSNALFSLETDGSVSKRSNRLERMAEEFLYRVQARRKRARSYCYLSWFLVLFFVFLSTQFMKEDNRNLFTVDKSIKTRVVNILPKGNLNADADFYNWLGSTIQDIFKPTVCGNGLCEAPEEYQSVGRFGCLADCGLLFNRSTLRVDLAAAWEVPGNPFAALRNKSVFGTGSLPVGFSYNIYSETMQAYVFSSNLVNRSVVFDVPDGILRLELYQNFLVSSETDDTDLHHGCAKLNLRRQLSSPVIGDLIQVAPDTLPEHNFLLPDFQYGEPAEVFGTAAALTIQLQDFCQEQGAAYPSICPNVSTLPTSPFLDQYLLDHYGLSGSVQLMRGSAGIPQMLASIPFCNFSGGGGPAVFNAALTAPCGPGVNGKITGGTCLNAQSLMRTFSCKSTYNISIWSWGPPRNVSVKPPPVKTTRAVTPFNNLIGGLIITQSRRKESFCPVDPPPQIKALINTFHCQMESRGLEFYGMDPTFVIGSSMYAGQISIGNFYAANEIRNQSTWSTQFESRTMKLRRIPYGFFPHQWGNGGLKPDKFIHKKDVGLYKVYWDSRLSSSSAQKLVPYLQTAAYLDEFTSTIEVEMITYNPEFAVFGVATFLFSWDLGGNILWDYQYDTVRLDIYSGGFGQQRFAIDIAFCIMLAIDIIREAKDMYDSIQHDRFFTHYCKSLFKYVNWIHYGLILASAVTWVEFNTKTSSIVLKESYPIVANLDAAARPFLAIPESEYEILSLVDKLRSLCEIKNRFAALNVLGTLLFIARVLKILDFQPRMALITRTLRQAGVDLVHFLLLFTVFLGGYSVIATLLLGGQLQEFNGLDTAAISLFFLCLGWEPKYASMLAAIETRQSTFAVWSFQFFYWSFISIASFILLNVVLAIIVEAYAVVKRKNMEVKSMGSDILEISGDAGRRIYNRLFESEVLVSDKKLENILLEATQKRGLRVRKKKSKFKGPNALRLPGGLVLTAKDLATLLEGAGTKGRSLLRRTSCSQCSVLDLATIGAEAAEVVDSDIEENFVISRPIQDVINRYEEQVDEVKEEHDFFRLIKAESLKRQMTLYPSVELLTNQIEDLKVTVGYLASKLLSKEEKSGLRFEKLIVAAQSNLLDRSVQISELLDINDSLSGELKITVVSAKFLSKEIVDSGRHSSRSSLLDESEIRKTYCVIFLEEESNRLYGPDSSDSEELEILVRTPTATLLDSEDRGWYTGNPDLVWNTAYVISLEAKKGSSIIVAIVDQHDKSEDIVIGTARIPLSRACLGEESDKWYPLHSVPEGTCDGSLIKLKVKFTVHSKSELEIIESLDMHTSKKKDKHALRRESADDEENMPELKKIQKKLRPLFSRAPSEELASFPQPSTAQLHPVPSHATIKDLFESHDSTFDIKMNACANHQEREALQSQASTTSNKGPFSDTLRQSETPNIPSELCTFFQSSSTPTLEGRDEASIEDVAIQPVTACPESAGNTHSGSQNLLKLEPSLEAQTSFNLNARPSFNLDARNAFAFRCSVRARLSLVDRLAKQVHPSLGGESFVPVTDDSL